MAKHRHFGEDEEVEEPVQELATSSRVVLDSGSESASSEDEAPQQVGLGSSRKQEKARARDEEVSEKQSREARRAANRARDASLKAAASTHKAREEPAPSQKRVRVEAAPVESSSRLPPSVFAAAQQAFDLAAQAHAEEQQAEKKQRVKKRKRQQVLGEGASRQIDSGLTVQHLPPREAEAAHLPPPRSTDSAKPTRSKTKFLKRLKRSDDPVGSRRGAQFGLGRRKGPAVAFARSVGR